MTSIVFGVEERALFERIATALEQLVKVHQSSYYNENPGPYCVDCNTHVLIGKKGYYCPNCGLRKGDPT